MDQHNGRNNSNFDQSTAHNGYVHGLSFTNDGLFLVSVGTDGRMRLWNTETGDFENIISLENFNEYKYNDIIILLVNYLINIIIR